MKRFVRQQWTSVWLQLQHANLVVSRIVGFWMIGFFSFILFSVHGRADPTVTMGAMATILGFCAAWMIGGERAAAIFKHGDRGESFATATSVATTASTVVTGDDAPTPLDEDEK